MRPASTAARVVVPEPDAPTMWMRLGMPPRADLAALENALHVVQMLLPMHRASQPHRGARRFVLLDDVVAKPRDLGIRGPRDRERELGGATRWHGEEHGLGGVVDPVDVFLAGRPRGLAGLLPLVEQEKGALIPE